MMCQQGGLMKVAPADDFSALAMSLGLFGDTCQPPQT